MVGAGGGFEDWQDHGEASGWAVLVRLNWLVLLLVGVYVHLFRTAERSQFIVIFF